MADMIKVISMDEAEEAFYAWAKHIWEANKEPIMIHKEDARQAAEALFGQIQINRGEQPNIRRSK